MTDADRPAADPRQPDGAGPDGSATRPLDDGYFVRLPAAGGAGPQPDDPVGPARGRAGTTPRPVPLVSALVVLTAIGCALVVGLLLFVGAGVSPAGDGAAPLVTADGDVAAVADGDGFAFWARRDDGTPVRWNPCEPIAWVMNQAGAPTGALADVEEAIDRLGDATGLEFSFLGTTDELPDRRRSLHQPERYGDRWAPVLFAWVDAEATSLPMEDDERGIAIPVAVTGPQGTVFVSGQIVLNAERRLGAGFGDRHGSWGATLLHELGHLVGLDHVDDRSQLMYPTATSGRAAYSAGDLRGLAALGADNGCLRVPPAQDLEVDFQTDLQPLGAPGR